MHRFFFLLLFLFFGAAATYFLSGQLADDVDPALLLPSETLAYVEIKKPAASLRKFKHSRLGRQVYSIKWPEVLRSFDVPDELVRDFSQSYYKIQEILDSRFFHELCGRRATLALLPLPGNKKSDRYVSDIQSSIVLISQPNHKASLLELFSFPFLRDYEYVSESYLGKEIRTFTFASGVEISTAVSDGFFVTAFSPEVVKLCLDQSIKSLTEGKSSLLQNAEYISFKSRTEGKDDQFVYVDLAGMRPLVSWPAGELHIGSYPYRSLCFFRRSQKGRVNFTSILKFDRTYLGTVEHAALYPDPEIISFLPEVPADLLAFYWTNMFDFRNLVHRLRLNRQSVTAQLLKGVDDWILSKANISFDDFLMLFGSRLAVNISEVWTDGFLPMPKLCFRLEVRNNEEVAQIMKKLVSGQHVNTSHFSGTEVHSIQLAGGLIQPAYAFKGNYLVFADSQKQMKVILAKKQNALVDDSTFKGVDLGMTLQNNMVTFVKNKELASALREITLWAGTLLAMNDQSEGLRTKNIIDRVILPILDGVKMYRAMGTRLYTSGSELVLESALLRDDKPDEGR